MALLFIYKMIVVQMFYLANVKEKKLTNAVASGELAVAQENLLAE
jgi:hypothetical protein